MITEYLQILEPDHIGPNEHKDLDDYIHCKSLLFRQCKQGIFNADDSHLEKILEGHTCKVETYGFSENADIKASDVHLMDKGGTLRSCISYERSYGYGC